MDDFNFLHSSLVRENSPDLFNLKNSFSKNYFSQVTFVFVGKDHRSLLDKSFNIELKINWDLIYTKSLEVFCRLREINNYSIFIMDVSNKNVNKEINHLREFKSRSNIFDLILVEGDISVQNLASIVKTEKCRLLESEIEKNNLENLISKIVEGRKKELKDLKKRNLLISGHEVISKDVLIPESLYGGSFKNALRVCLESFNGGNDNIFFIWGGKGVGKKKLAELIHLNSSKCDKDIKFVNIRSIPKDYLDNYFFDKKRGALEDSSTGTICLVNIRIIDLEDKLVLKNIIEKKKRFSNLIIILQEEEQIKIEINLDEVLKSVFLKSNIQLLPLKDRKDELKPLLKHYLIKFQKFHNNYFSISEKVFHSLKNYHWPGNLIELENLIEGICATFDKKELELEDLPQKYVKELNYDKELDINFGGEGIDLNDYLKKIETKLIKKALEKTNGNKNRASKLLSLNRTTLIEKMKKRSINRNYPSVEN